LSLNGDPRPIEEASAEFRRSLMELGARAFDAPLSASKATKMNNKGTINRFRASSAVDLGTEASIEGKQATLVSKKRTVSAETGSSHPVSSVSETQTQGAGKLISKKDARNRIFSAEAVEEYSRKSASLTYSGGRPQKATLVDRLSAEQLERLQFFTPSKVRAKVAAVVYLRSIPQSFIEQQQQQQQQQQHSIIHSTFAVSAAASLCLPLGIMPSITVGTTSANHPELCAQLGCVDKNKDWQLSTEILAHYCNSTALFCASRVSCVEGLMLSTDD
jgi:hypothetical protein